jgi:SnoaL-like domain
MSTGDISGFGPEPEAAEEAPSIEWIGAFVERWLEAWNSHRADRVVSLMIEHVEVRDDSWPRTMRGHADVRELLEALWRAVPDMTFELLNGPYVIPGEPRASFHWRGFGTFTGRMDPPALHRPAADGSHGERAVAAAQRWTTRVQHLYRQRRSYPV